MSQQSRRASQAHSLCHLHPSSRGSVQQPVAATNRATAPVPPLTWSGVARASQPQIAGQASANRQAVPIPPVRMPPTVSTPQTSTPEVSLQRKTTGVIPPVRMRNTPGARQHNPRDLLQGTHTLGTTPTGMHVRQRDVPRTESLQLHYASLSKLFMPIKRITPVIQRMEASNRTKQFLASLEATDVTITQGEIMMALQSLDSGSQPNLGSSVYILGGAIDASGGTISIHHPEEGRIASVKCYINGDSVNIYEINTKPIFGGQGMFALAMCALLQAAKKYGATTITSTNITNTDLWSNIQAKGSNIDAFLAKYQTVKVPRSIKKKTEDLGLNDYSKKSTF